jgi:hypothetical protein
MEAPSSPIELNRQFAILPAGPIDDENSYLLSSRPAVGWAELLDHPRVVILAAARSGKTTELECTAKRLNLEGKSAFFIRLNDLADSTLDNVCRRGEASLAAWMKDTTHGWFLLDARDELVLTGCEFYRALEHLEEGLRDSAARARIVISSRPTDWNVHADRKDFERILPTPAFDAVNDAESTDMGPSKDIDELASVMETRRDSAKNNVLFVQMRPLDEERILKLATHLGISDAEAFRTKLHELDAIPLAGRPGDLIGIVNFWKDRRDIRNYEEILKATIKSSLADLRKIPGTRVELPVDQYNIGAERLAATMTLGRGTAFQYGAGEFTEQSSSVIRPDDAFTDWPPSQLDAVLRTNLFEPQSLGLVHFHSRSIKEYLTAQWILSIKGRSGLSRSELHNILFSDIYGESILIPSMAPIAAWVAIQDEYVRTELLSRSPETFLEYGDPEQLTTQAKIDLLHSVICTTLKKGSRLSTQDSRILRALANPVLSNTIRKLWQSSSQKSSTHIQRYRDDSYLFLLRLIQLGEMKDLAPTVYKCAITRSNSWIVTVFAVRAMIALRGVPDLKRFVRYLIRNGHRLNRHLVLGAAQDLYPEYMDATTALALVDLHEKPSRSFDMEPEYALGRLVEQAKGEAQRLELLGELTTRWTKLGSGSEADPYVYPDKTAARWIVPTILKLANRIFTENRQTSVADDQILAIAAAIKHAEDRDHQKEARETLNVLLNRLGRLRIFWILLNNFKGWLPYSRIEWQLPAKINILASWIGFQEPDLDSLLAATTDSRKESAFRAALTIWRNNDCSATIKARIQKAAGNDKSLHEVINEYAPATEPPGLRENRERSRQMALQRQAQKEQAAEGWKLFKGSLERNPGLLTDKSKPNAQFTALYNLYTRMTQKRNEDREVHARSNWRDLIPEFGEVVANAAARGFKEFWRTYTSKLPSTLQGIERNQTPFMTIVSLSGLAIEAKDDDAWMEKLSPTEVGIAVTHAFREMNGFPFWLPGLAAKYSDTVNPLVEAEILFELDDADRDVYPSILSRLPRQDAEKWPGLVERVLKALRTAKAVNSRAFGYAIDVLIGAGQVAGAEAARLYRMKLSLKKENEEHKIAYVAAWFALDADVATDALHALLHGKSREEKDRIVEEIFSRLAGEVRRNPIQFSIKNRARTLERLVSLAFLHIRQVEDIEHEGVYSPGRRDSAESGRGYVLKLLVDTPGHDTYRALIRLAEKPHMKSIAEGLRRRAFERAQSDSEVRWKPADVLQYEQEKAREPQSTADLFGLVQRRLCEIKEDLENGDFSQKRLLKLDGVKERHYQIWLAEQLELRARGFYTTVREPEVITSKKPDVVIYRTKVGARVPIEVKVADALTGTKLLMAFKKQLISQYQRDRKATHGILLLIGLKESKSWIFPTRRVSGIEDLRKVIVEFGLKDQQFRGMGIVADVVTLRLWE